MFFKKTPPVAEVTDRVVALLAGFQRGTGSDEWIDACRQIGEAARSGLDEGEVVALIDALPKIDAYDDCHDPQPDILCALQMAPVDPVAYVAPLERAMPALRPASHGWALGILARCPGGLDAVIRLAPHYPDLSIAVDVLGGCDDQTTRPQRRALLALTSHPRLVTSIARIALGWLADTKVSPDELDPYAPAFLAGYRAACANLDDLDDATATEALTEAGVFIDLFGHLSAENIRSELVAAARDPTRGLAVFAVAAQLRSKGWPDLADLERVCAHDLARWRLYELLPPELRHRIPERWRTQEALARGDLARWCAAPTGFGKPPEEMELMQRLDVPGDPEPRELYVFRFWMNDRWLAGVAGPYPKQRGPHLSGPGTFSMSEAADSATPEEHARAIAKALREMWGLLHR